MADDSDPTAVDAEAVAGTEVNVVYGEGRPQTEVSPHLPPSEGPPVAPSLGAEVRQPEVPPPLPQAAPQPGAQPAADTRLYVHDQSKPSSTVLADTSRRQRKRERDANAERAAQRMVLFIFLGLGAAALAFVNSDILSGKPPPEPAPAVGVSGPVVPAPVRPSAPHLSATPSEAPDIPALEAMRREGLTIVAEGLPRVIAIDPPTPPQALAGIESCRFAYAVWEFSPNDAFRFFSTCGALEGETLVGAYQIDGSNVRLSPIQSGPAQLVTVFRVERPSTIITEVTLQAATGQPVRMRVQQRVTGMRPGMDGERYRATYAKRNTLQVRGVNAPRRVAPSVPAPAPARPPSDKSDPVLDLIRGN